MGDSDLPRLVAAINCIKYKVPMVSIVRWTKPSKRVLPRCNCNQSCSSAINSEVRTPLMNHCAWCHTYLWSDYDHRRKQIREHQMRLAQSEGAKPSLCAQVGDFSRGSWLIWEIAPEGLVLVARDPHKRWSKSNCYWGPKYKACVYHARARIITWNGISTSIGDWGRRLKIRPCTIASRLYIVVGMLSGRSPVGSS
jgi:hypothetical protein